jgi:predicted N-acyltransferase
MAKKSSYQLKIIRSMADISREDWNSLVTDDTVPFLEWEWLSALEESGIVSPQNGWHPLHICLWDKERLAAAAPLYVRNSSGGEFVFDYLWAEAAHSMGRSWYPKMTGTLPITPAEGYRFLTLGGIEPQPLCAAMLDAAETICRQNRIASLNLLWVDPAWAEMLGELGYNAWDHFHYLWENQNFSSFDDYLALFSKNQRKNIRREYNRHLEQGISIRVVPGQEAKEEHYRLMYELYSITNDKFIPWDARWANQEFFLRLEKSYRSRTAFVEARRDNTGEILALAFLVHKGNRLWGRYWGAFEEIRNLHFAVCYYAPMDWCIKNGIRYFDPGAGSPYKIRRGFRAIGNRSWHKFFDPSIEQFFKQNIATVNHYEAGQIRALNEELPFKGK